jgi:hypothetical protein
MAVLLTSESSLMLLIIAEKQDRSARWLAERWSRFGAELLSPSDLSLPGWRHHVAVASKETAVINGRTVPVEEIAGVLTRLPYISEHELVHIVPPDRAYVAAEMTAFFLSWLTGLNCPLLNRPTPTCISGCNWRLEQWIYLATLLGVPVIPVRRHAKYLEDLSTNPSIDPFDTVTVIGERCIGAIDERQATYARRLAAAAGMDLLAVYFRNLEGEPRLLNASLWPDVTSVEVADGMLEYFQGSCACEMVN